MVNLWLCGYYEIYENLFLKNNFWIGEEVDILNCDFCIFFFVFFVVDWFLGVF